jgi:DNA-binding PadR family transcriptional regulator
VESPLSTRAVLLLALRHGPGCGLRLIERLGRDTGGGIRPAEGSVYPTLARLEREGLVRRLGRPSEKARGRARVDFELTPAGVVASHDVKRLLQAFTRGGRVEVHPPERSAAMSERLREGMELSDFALRLRDRVARSRGVRR